ncbi:hypothetical protein M0L20_14880 [Spirosoma sp. RP8]|uniref:DUF3806 domain-containing protein n=1 Tax=Spirosoma liriopis TaxID=2937440 RepID=A0ABT0HLU6_9BACT|nr:hypothetical protein [Spirosoma liriopis]MCK8493151.1 hypothetical protein [Spirosoma liriopis]
MEDFQEKVENLAERFAEAKKSGVKGKSPLDTFRENYIKLNESVINPLITDLNNILSTSGSKLDFVVSDLQNESYLSTQIVFHDVDKKWNLLSDPYLLVEGYPKNNQIVISEGLSKEWGTKISVEEVNEDIIESYKKTIASNLVNLMEKQLA